MSTVDKIETKPVTEGKPMDYVGRMREELEDLNERTVKLSKFFMTPKFGSLPKRKQDILYNQFEGMQKYLAALSQRYALEVYDE